MSTREVPPREFRIPRPRALGPDPEPPGVRFEVLAAPPRRRRQPLRKRAHR